MRTCLSFLAVEYMRAGKTPQDACKLSIERLLKLESNQFEKMHSKLTVGLIAMNSEGKVIKYLSHGLIKIYDIIFTRLELHQLLLKKMIIEAYQIFQ